MNVRRYSTLAAAALAFGLSGAAFADGFARLGDAAPGFAEATAKKQLLFPADLGAHPGFRIEWWYLTANLEDEAGVAYGVQWTLFRQATEPGRERPGWANQNVWMGHAAITSASDHLFAETRARGGVGQAGVEAEPFRAWIDDWSFAALDGRPGAGLARAGVSASAAGFRYELELSADAPFVLHGDDGLSRKSERGQASYYYSQPFFKAKGALVIGDREVKVSGRAWMDREWSSQPLASDQKGWDWFSLHLESGEKLMLFRLRSETANAYRAGTFIAADGTTRTLASDDIDFAPLSTTRLGDRSFPTGWRVRVKSINLDIETSPLNARSVMATSFQYWEGPIIFRGTHQGRGYLEMTGY
ncbi:MAG: iron ABC transporter permease [Methylocystaceae bacterium]|nr:MAG: iron ABC transporter permease [Methylocystaceae bacterium]